MYYQFIIELDIGICIGVELLVCWQWFDGSLVCLDLFILLVEDIGLIEVLIDQVMDNVIVDMCDLLVQDCSVYIVINFVVEDVSSGCVLKVLMQKLQGMGIYFQQIWLEVIECGFIDIQCVCNSLVVMCCVGYCVVIDDFGVGYFSLQYLQQLLLDVLKIDKFFIDVIGIDSVISLVILYIIDMVKMLGLFIVVEGVEIFVQFVYL